MTNDKSSRSLYRVLPKSVLIVFLIGATALALVEAVHYMERSTYEPQALEYAVYSGDPLMVKELLRIGADPNARRRSDDRRSALTLRAFSYLGKERDKWDARLQVLHLLIKAGGDLRSPKDGETYPLVDFLSILPRNWDQDEHAQAIVRHMLKRGAHPDTADENGWSAVTIAATRGLREVSTILVQAGATVVLFESIALGNIEALEKQVEAYPSYINSRSSHHHSSLLQFAVRCDANDMVRLLLENGADPNARDNFGYSSLHYAVMARSPIDIKYSIQSASPDSVPILLEHGADPNLKSARIMGIHAPYKYERNDYYVFDSKQTPLHFACHDADVITVRKLLDAGAHVNGQDHARITPLHYAALRNDSGRMDIIRLLLENDASASQGDSNGRSALNNAVNHMDESTLPSVRMLIEHGAPVDAPFEGGDTPLHHVMLPSVARLLIELGADVNAQDRDGVTPLHSILGGAHPEPNSYENLEALVTLLTEHGADITAVDRWGRMPGNYLIRRDMPDWANKLPRSQQLRPN